ncbi:MAG TPA: prolyl oligopeptidase family serine peptidase [Nannocystaceae bacterium]|nr:prolyl oligopeptidase family serine peptidase [Nannocystaceae bacterium]
MMRRGALLVASLVACAPHAAGPARDGPPATRREAIVEELHGTQVADPYRWLERADDAEVKTWSVAQDAYARGELAALRGRDELRRRARELIDIDDVSVPTRYGDRVFQTRRHRGRDKAVYYVRERDGRERVLLDPNRLSPDGSVSVRGIFPSRDGRYVAYKLSRNAADAATLHIRDLDRDVELEQIEGARYAAPSWTKDGFYYTALPTDPLIPPPELPGRAEVRFHRVGTPPSSDALVHPALHDPKTFLAAEVSKDGHWLLLTIARGFDAQDVWFIDLRGKARVFQPLAVGTSHRYSVIAHRDAFYVHTNDGAPRFRVMKVDPAHVERAAWRELVAQEDATLHGFGIVGGMLELDWLWRAQSRIELRTTDGVHVRNLALPGIGTSDGLVGHPERDEAYWRFSSFAIPGQIHRTSIATGASELVHEVELPVDTDRFEVKQVVYASKDGTPITMFVVHRDDLVFDGSSPAVLTGYGGFGVSMTPAFSSTIVMWLEHGGVWAMPNLRGGGEYGEAWHDAGKRHNKQNVFDDFIAAGEWLVDNGYTKPERLAIRGGSNGGLLVGAVATQRPELFGAVICAVPLLDMIRYHHFGAGPTWITEYGSADDATDFRTLFAYSPYHRVQQGVDYPPLLMLSADSDDRVDPMHARKLVAALQHTGSSALLRVEKNAGHGGADSLRAAIEQQVDTFAFLLHELD